MTDTNHASTREAITLTRNEDGFAVFSGDGYAVAIDPAFKLNEKVGVIVEAFQVKSATKLTAEELAAEVFAAIASEGGAE